MRNLLLLGLSAVAATWSLAAECQTPASVPDPGEVFRDCQDCPEMVVVPAGDFNMGATDTPFAMPVHKVTIAQPFAIGRREVTFEQWDQCVAELRCKGRVDDRGWGRGTRPVINVSWDDAKDFVAWLSQKTGKGYRLPSEAEWEYAARAGTNTAFWWGRTADKGHANCADCGAAPTRQTTPAGSYRPNGFGLFDVAGNAAEWVEDCWHENYRGAPANGTPWTAGQCPLHVLRGGSFSSRANLIQSAARWRYDHDVRYSDNGFRVARDLR